MEYIVAIIIGLLAGVVIYFLLNYRDSNTTFIKSKFQREQDKVLRGLSEKKDYAEKEMNEELQQKLDELRATYDHYNEGYEKKKQEYENDLEQKKQDFETKTKELQTNYEERQQYYSKIDVAAAEQRQKDNELQIGKEKELLSLSLQKLQSDYKEQKEMLDKDWQMYHDLMNEKKSKLDQEIKTYEEKQLAIIEQFKKDEETRIKRDFYRISVSDTDKQDIVKLKALALEFSKPECIYKLIYEVYYKAKLEELFKRVLGENKDKGGIYKITNISNEKAYIGKTTSFLTRFRTHSKRGCNIERINGQLYDAMYNEGIDNFTFEIVEVCGKDEQSEKEKYWIDFYNSKVYGYNSKSGG